MLPQICGIFCPRYILSDPDKWEQFQEDLHHFPFADKLKIHLYVHFSHLKSVDDKETVWSLH